ncbi:hypothetical protein SAMN05192561_12321 [Halopenitus malekzadehii]|uniref:TFIIB-type zinc ribbon-containing protein n=1 Tax=Halopenitus malekzadehii TaxID=1267564 RepID=A0A1H6JTT8_9EURY|nr:hypothetical protein [Halopenitus malekzadehii]SEH66022.1 hypothetical protein SAMN05192561_12321 [Halopenitus malekzadehii]
MKVRGERECTSCGTQWSYYETGEVACPECGSVRSVGISERRRHTDSPATLELTAHRARFGEATGALPSEGVDDLKRDLREYVRKRGFIDGGELQDLDDEVLLAHELLQAVDLVDRLPDLDGRDREYLLRLLSCADEGDRPTPGDVPPNLHPARGLAAVEAVEAYREDLRTYLDDLAADGTDGRNDGSEEDADRDLETAHDVLESLRDRSKRIESLQGDVDPETAETLVRAADDLGRYLRTGEPDALQGARSRLSDPVV